MLCSRRTKIDVSWHIWCFIFWLMCKNLVRFFWNSVDSYGLDNDDFNTEELEEAVADIQDTLGADNYEDQLPQPEVKKKMFERKILLKCSLHPCSPPHIPHSKLQCATCIKYFVRSLVFHIFYNCYFRFRFRFRFFVFFNRL